MTRFSHIPTLVSIILFMMVNSVLAFDAQPEALMYRPGLEYRSLNTGSYEIAIQKNGLVDVGLSTGEAVFLNAFPMVWLEGKKGPVAARLDGRLSNRFEVNDRLGRGQGMRIQFKQNLWTLRTYPTKPFFAVQYTYTNTSKKPVAVKQLIPWAIGDPKKGSITLGENTLDSIMLIDAMSNRPAQRVKRDGKSANMMTVLNPQTGRSLLVGFISQDRGFGEIQMAAREVDPKEPNQLDYMRAITTFDPPITLQPGESLDSEILYLAIIELDPLLAMERYAKGIAVTNQIPIYDKVPPRTVWIYQQQHQDEAAYHQELQDSIAQLKTTLSASESAQLVLSLDQNPAGPGIISDETLKTWIDEIHQQGFQVGLADNPFTFPMDFSVVKDHQDWFLSIPHPKEASFIVSDRLIDVTHPEANQWFESYLRQRKKDLAFDSLWLVNPREYLKIANHEYFNTWLATPGNPTNQFKSGKDLTRVEVIRVAMDTMRKAIGPKVPVMFASQQSLEFSPDLFPTFPNTHFTYTRSQDISARFFMAPHLGLQYSFHGDPENKSIYSSFLLRGQHVIETPKTLAQSIHSPYIPALTRPAKPEDLFYTDTPSIWLKRGLVKTGNWILAGITNDTEVSKTITLPLKSRKLRVQPQYTLFDVEQQRYFGKAQHQINISVAGDTARVLLLREVKHQPMVVGSTYPIADTLPDKTNERWSRNTGKLSGRISTHNTTGTVFVLVPKSLKPAQLLINGKEAPWAFKDELLNITVPEGIPSPVEWSLTFTR